ncbi:hypothetical protein Tco_0681428 [Tanacetum coccineum]|uniref:Uncharacterized protein n=1 Tax=Tanacetum coccineum TaxID=301880 RepID=A0ABQ4XNB4_9ASTR
MKEDFDNITFGQIMTLAVSEHFFHTKPSIGQRFVFMLRKGTDFFEELVEMSWKKETANERSSKFISCFNSSFIEFVQPCFCFFNSEEFMNVFMRIGFGSTINLVSFDKGQVLTFNGKFVCGFWNSDCGTGSQSDNAVGSLHGFIIHWIVISKNIKKVTEVIDVKNWRLTATRPDIQFSIVLCARYQSNPKESHLTAVKRILGYLKCTPTLGLYYPKCSGFDLKGYSDSDYAGCNMDKKSTSSSSQILGVKLVCWSAKKHHLVAMSLAEAEYIATAGCCLMAMSSAEAEYVATAGCCFLVLNGQRPLTLDFNTFCSSTGLDYNNGKYMAHPTPKTVKKELGKIAINPSYLDKTPFLKNSFPMAWRIMFTFVIQVDIGEIIYSDLVTKLLNKSRLKYVSYPRFISCALQVLLGFDYTQDIRFGYLPAILSKLNFTKDPSKVTEIELTAHMIAVNNQRDSGPKASRALSKKSKKPKSKKTPAETKATSTPKPTEGSEQSHSVSSGTVPDPQDPERNIQLVGTGLPFTSPNEGIHTSQPLLEGTTTAPKDSVGNKQPIDMGLTSTASDEIMAKSTPRTGAKYLMGQTQSTRLRYQSLTENKGNPPHKGELDTQHLVLSTYADVRAFLLSDDKAQESEEDILGAGEEMVEDPYAAKIQHQSSPPQADKP